MTTMTARRTDERLGRPQPAVVQVASDVLGGPVNASGPVWVLDPSRELQRRFWASVGDTLGAEDRVFVARGEVLAEQLHDVHGAPIPGLERDAGPVALFFIDHAPLANWAHACEYVLLHRDGAVTRAAHDTPPASSFRLVPISRLQPVP